MDFFMWLKICPVVSLLVKYDIVRSDIKQITPVLSLTGISSSNSGLCPFGSVPFHSRKILENQENQEKSRKILKEYKSRKKSKKTYVTISNVFYRRDMIFMYRNVSH